jgi:hypothetical protein
VPEVRWQEIWWAAFVWGMVSLLPLGIALSAVRSFPILIVGMAIVAGTGGLRSYLHQTHRIKQAECRNRDEEQEEAPEQKGLVQLMAALDKVRQANVNRVKNHARE